jgi:iron complex transport system permease protein
MRIVFLLKKPALLLVSFMLGAVTERPLFSVLMSSGLILVGFILALLLSRQADILSLGEEQAEVLGANIKKLRYAVLFCVALLVGGGIGLCGAIGFVGFIVPHIARIIMGPKVRGLLFASALLGAAFLVNMEVINRLVFHPRQVPVGILCAALGAPFFLWVLLRSKGEYF